MYYDESSIGGGTGDRVDITNSMVYGSEKSLFKVNLTFYSVSTLLGFIINN